MKDIKVDERYKNEMHMHTARIGGLSGIILLQLPVYFLNILTYMVLKGLESKSYFFYQYDSGEKAFTVFLWVTGLQILYGVASLGFGFVAIPSSILCWFILMNIV